MFDQRGQGNELMYTTDEEQVRGAETGVCEQAGTCAGRTATLNTLLKQP